MSISATFSPVAGAFVTAGNASIAAALPNGSASSVTRVTNVSADSVAFVALGGTGVIASTTSVAILPRTTMDLTTGTATNIAYIAPFGVAGVGLNIVNGS